MMKKKKAKKTEKRDSNLYKGYFLWKDGMNAKEIAMKLNEKEETVKEWINFYLSFDELKKKK